MGMLVSNKTNGFKGKFNNKQKSDRQSQEFDYLSAFSIINNFNNYPCP